MELSLILLLFPGKALIVFLCGARPPIHGEAGPAELPQGLQHRLLGAHMAHQQAVPQLPPGAGLPELRELTGRLDRTRRLLKGPGGGEGAELHQQTWGRPALQGNVQSQPGGQGGPLGRQLLPLGQEGVHLPLLRQHTGHRLVLAGGRLGGTQLLLGGLGPGGEEPSPLGPVVLQNTHGPLRLLAAGLGL